MAGKGEGKGLVHGLASSRNLGMLWVEVIVMNMVVAMYTTILLALHQRYKRRDANNTMEVDEGSLSVIEDIITAAAANLRYPAVKKEQRQAITAFCEWQGCFCSFTYQLWKVFVLRIAA